MTDVAITAANVKRGANAVVDLNRDAGATITAGQVVFQNASNDYVLTDANGTGTKTAGGISLNGASDGQPIAVQNAGDITVGGTLVPGTTYCASATPGGICPQSDITTGDDVIILGVAKSASVLTLRIINPGVTL